MQKIIRGSNDGYKNEYCKVKSEQIALRVRRSWEKSFPNFAD